MKMLRTGEVAKRLGVTRKTIWNMIQRGSFPNAIKLDPDAKSIYLIPEEDIDNLLKKQASGGKAG